MTKNCFIMNRSLSQKCKLQGIDNFMKETRIGLSLFDNIFEMIL
jgi:hypothetical protein